VIVGNQLSTRRQWLAAAASAACASPLSAAGEEIRPWPRGTATPALKLPTQDGAIWDLGSARGRPVLLNFWASWCEPCRREMPSIEQLSARRQAQGLVVVAINFRETDGAVRRFLETTTFSLPILRDRDGGAAKAFGVRIFPSTVLIDRRGHAKSVVVGDCDWSGPSADRWLASVL
jgi:thiol-disulfide isomerase/thioredoxin